MLRDARLLTRPPPRAPRYAKGSAETLRLPGSSVSVACVHHWADLDAGLREARLVLRPGGRLVAIERLTRPGAAGLASHGWTADQASAFADRCLAHGFTVGRRTTVSVTATAP